MKTGKKFVSLMVCLMLICSMPLGVFADKEAEPAAEALDADLFIKDRAPAKDYAYSFAVIGDTQVTTADYPDKLSCIYDWLVENAASKKIKFVFGLGDITYYSTRGEWSVAKKEINKLNGVIPYSILRGNHDTIETYTETFPLSEYADTIDGSYNNTMLYTYQKFNVGKLKYLVLNLDTYPADEILSWASGVISDHPDYNVIVSTHAYLNGKGDFYTGNADANDGDEIWEKLVKNHKNIVLVLCGHVGTDKVVVNKREGVHGNIVTEMLVDPQGTEKRLGPGGYVAMLYFSEDGKNVQVEYYSTVNQAHFREDNQFSMELSVIEPKGNVGIIIGGACVLVLLSLVIIFRKKLFRKKGAF